MIPRPTDFPAIDPATGLVNAIIETPKQARAKLDYDPETGYYKLHDVLPEGFTFPFNFGFVPSTLAEDGDPLDVLVCTDAILPTGSLLTVRLLGVIEAEETVKNRSNRNDRLIATPSGDPAAASLTSIDQLRPEFLDQIERFFRNYGEFKGKQWKTLGRGGPDRALALIERAIEQRRRDGQKPSSSSQ
ncbi:MAG TPA: inorganic diphosphatase [Bryobacteraceae bacterium]|nr:inorganic diphosphatase [Bryobacteraceae bacterium]